MSEEESKENSTMNITYNVGTLSLGGVVSIHLANASIVSSCCLAPGQQKCRSDSGVQSGPEKDRGIPGCCSAGRLPSEIRPLLCYSS